MLVYSMICSSFIYFLIEEDLEEHIPIKLISQCVAHSQENNLVVSVTSAQLRTNKKFFLLRSSLVSCGERTLLQKMKQVVHIPKNSK